MRPPRYRPSDPNSWYDPVSGHKVPFDVFLKRADQILGAYDRAVEARDKIRHRLMEGVPPHRFSYWQRRVRETRTAVAEWGGFVREVDEQLSRPSAVPAGRLAGGRSRSAPSPAPPTPKATPARPPGVPPTPRYEEFELGLNYDAALAHDQSSAVDVNVRFRRRDGTAMTMDEAWDAVSAYRLSGDGQFPSDIVADAINWARPRKRKRAAANSQEILDALHDFLFIAMSMNKSDMTLEGLRLGSIKEG